jgi:hypothetical protein
VALARLGANGKVAVKVLGGYPPPGFTKPAEYR